MRKQNIGHLRIHPIGLQFFQRRKKRSMIRRKKIRLKNPEDEAQNQLTTNVIN